MSQSQNLMPILTGGTSLVKPTFTNSIFYLIPVVVLGILLIVLGIINLYIFGECPDAEKPNVALNRETSAFAVGAGVGLIMFIILGFTLELSANFTVLFIAILIAATAAATIYYINVNDIPTLRVLTLGLLGAGVGLIIGFLLKMFTGEVNILLIQILVIIAAVATIVFASFGINMFNKCGMPSTATTFNILNIGFIVIGILLLIGVIVSFFYI